MFHRMFTSVSLMIPTSSHKVTIIGAGNVGMACAFAMLCRGVSNEIAIMDTQDEKLEAELLDIKHGSSFLRPCIKISGGADYSVTVNSKVVIITAGSHTKPGESRLDLLDRNVGLVKDIAKNVANQCPEAVLLIVSNPVDILTYVAWKTSGFPVNRVIGAGTNLDTSRLKYLLSEILHTTPHDIQGWVIGEHGDSSVALWSGINVLGMRLHDWNSNIGSEKDEENWKQVHEDVINSSYKIVKRKGYTSWAIALSVVGITQSILYNSNETHAVSTRVQDIYGIKEDVFLSLPCKIGKAGIIDIIAPTLSKTERDQFYHSVQNMDNIIKSLKCF